MDNKVSNILSTFSTILENKKIVISEAPANTDNLFNNRNFNWGGGPSDHRSRPLGNWQSDNAWDIMAPAGTPVYAIEGGTISKLGGSTELRKGVIYGYNITIKSSDNEFFYTHLGSRNPSLQVGSTVNKGDFLGEIGIPKENPKWPQHVHIGVRNGDIKKYIDRSGNILQHEGGSTGEAETSSDSESDTGIGKNTMGSIFSNSNKTQSKSIGSVPEDTLMTQAFTQIGKALGLKESFGVDVKETFGKLVIPSSKNTKIISPAEGIIDNGKYFGGCKNQTTIKLADGQGYLRFCGITNPQVGNGDSVSIGSVLGMTKDDVEVTFYNTRFSKQKLKKNFTSKKNKKQEDDDNDSPKIKSKFKGKEEGLYKDPLLFAIPELISNVFKDKVDDKGNVEKRWGYATDKDQVDPWIVNTVSKPFKKIGNVLGTNKLKEDIDRIKKLL
jgi:murein DD-endopeptidase MepM/ murein hydrolase activator NlpD